MTYMIGKYPAVAVLGGMLLAGCGSTGSDQAASNNGGTATAPTPTVTKVDFTTSMKNVMAMTDSQEPMATDGVEFDYADNENPTVFAALLPPE